MASSTLIVDVTAWRQQQPFVDGPYACSGGTADGFDALIVRVTAADGWEGFGEAAPLGAFYDAAFPGGMRAGVEVLAPALLGLASDRIGVVDRRLDEVLRGHPYAKSAIDMAVWDLACRRRGVALADALGGNAGPTDLYQVVGPEAADPAGRAADLVERGYRRLQVKVGRDPREDAERVRAVRAAVGAGIPLFADANAGYTTAAARRFIAAAAGVDLWFEQPCATLAECAAIRGVCPWPLVLDESITSLATLVDARGIADAITIKLARVGGITKAAGIRDAAVALGLHVTIEDTGGADIDTAAMAHLSASTPARLRLHTVDFNAWVTISNAAGMPAPQAGQLAAPTGPGLGIAVDVASLGEPFLRCA